MAAEPASGPGLVLLDLSGNPLEGKAGGGAVEAKSGGGIDLGLMTYFALWYYGNYYYNITNKLALKVAPVLSLG